MLKRQMGPMRTISIKYFNAGTFLRNIQVTYTHAQLKGGNEAYRIGLNYQMVVGFMYKV